MDLTAKRRVLDPHPALSRKAGEGAEALTPILSRGREREKKSVL
jgi:hypothetical protein